MHELPIATAMEMLHQGFASDISTGVIVLTPAGRKKLGASAVGVTLVIEGTQKKRPGEGAGNKGKGALLKALDALDGAKPARRCVCERM